MPVGVSQIQSYNCACPRMLVGRSLRCVNVRVCARVGVSESTTGAPASTNTSVAISPTARVTSTRIVASASTTIPRRMNDVNPWRFAATR